RRAALPPDRSPAATRDTTSRRCRHESPSGGQTRLPRPVTVTTEETQHRTIEALDHGFVRLDGVMADHLSVVNGACGAFAPRKTELDESAEALIRCPRRARPGSPFEHNAFRFHVRCPIFVAREWFRHRVGSFNEFSLRYARATDAFYVPEAE